MAPLLRSALLAAAAAAAAAAGADAEAAGSSDLRGALPRILEEDDSCPAGSAACSLNVLQYAGSESSTRRTVGSGTLDVNGTSTAAKLLQLATGTAAAAFRDLDLDRLGSGGCVAQSFLSKLSSAPYSCSTVEKLAATSQQLPTFLGCHTQGIAVDEKTGSVVITCEDITLFGAKGRVGLWPRFKSFTQASAVEGDTGDQFTQFHPSATQMLEGVVPVFFANPLNVGPSTLRFYKVSGGRLAGPLGQTIGHPESHMGAVGFAKVSGSYVIVACGWDCKQFGVWSSSQGPTSGYTRSFYTDDSSCLVSGSRVGDAVVNAYNSLYLATDCNTNQPYLFGSFEDTLEVWRVDGLLTASPRMTKVAVRSFLPGNIFAEGYSMVTSEDGSDASIYAIPSNFHDCKNGLECADKAYLCNFK